MMRKILDLLRCRTREGDAWSGAFRDFLVKSPSMFMGLGERIGGVSHIASFWRYRFPQGSILGASVEELMDILQDFEASLGLDVDVAA